MNLADNLTATVSAHPDRVAIRFDDVALTYADFDCATKHVAGLLQRRGVQIGDRVALMAPNVPHWAIVYYGILRAGAVAVPMNPLLKSREVAYYLSDSGAALLFAWHDLGDQVLAGAEVADADVVLIDPAEFGGELAACLPVEDVVDRAANDTAVLLYTSGTTGSPKGAELTHENLTRNVEICARELFDSDCDDVIFGGLPLFHVFGQTCGLNVAIAVGATLTLLARFDPAKALEIVQRDKVTILQGVPTMYTTMLNHPDRDEYAVSSLRLCVSGGAALPLEVLTGFEKVFGAAILEGYGLSETSPVATFNRADRRRAGSIGTPIPGVEFRIVDEAGANVPAGDVGEIAIRGHNVMKGYWGRPDATEEAVKDGWFHTGDLAREDDDGYFFIVDRKKDMIIRGGYNVYPREIEEVAYEHPAVAEVAVIGVPHAQWGEEIYAVVALKTESTATEVDIFHFIKDRVAAYKYPRIVRVIGALPKGPTGKILKREIRVE
ncbi:long-chain-fatty-acid--CoA ligase [Rhodococcus erythropolis]|uniref:long-chain-fatty-acid--CoA ligase n=1 Tax=Rhodococcus erythropolis TaxID=1833 RepID=UPI001290913B|nr:long-chain fatty acid--CoA ligase [Rhodococcus erythropolis]MQP33246.1 long-chain-fatty-acid--CoA ligase [Rhodococcus erythropolis]